MDITINEKDYADVGKEFVRKFITRVVSVLSRAGLIDIDAEQPKEIDISLVFDICFFSFVTLEDQGHFEAGGAGYVAKLVFADKASSPSFLLAGEKRVLHGLIEDDLIGEVFADLRKNATEENPKIV